MDAVCDHGFWARGYGPVDCCWPACCTRLPGQFEGTQKVTRRYRSRPSCFHTDCVCAGRPPASSGLRSRRCGHGSDHSRRHRGTRPESVSISSGRMSTRVNSTRNRLPAALILPTLDDALAAIGRSADAHRFAELAAATLARFPELAGSIARKQLVLLEHHADWPRVLDILAWFAAHPRCGLYPRQISTSLVSNTKFIEARKVVLGELLDLVLPANAVEHSALALISSRCAMVSRQSLCSFATTCSIPHWRSLASLISACPLPSSRSSTSPRRSNLHSRERGHRATFPQLPDSMLIFGGGYGIDRLATAQWLCSRTVVYWGDIDTHGFAILHRLRALFRKRALS